MSNLLKSQKGVTLIYLATAVIVLIIITNVILYSLKDNLQVEQLKNMQNDITNIRDKVNSYYAQYGEIPANKNIEYNIAGRDIQTSGIISTAVDTGKFYVIDLKAIENLSLNYGKDYEKYKQIVGNNTEITDEMKNQVNQLTDIYIINGDSNNVFYVQGIEIDGQKFYTDYSVEDVDKVPVSLVDIPEKTKDDLSEFQTADTKPYLPGDDFSHVEGTDLKTGLVVTDGTNYWTWVEVPKTQVFASDTTENNYEKIEDDLEAYTGTLLSRNGYTDQWYDYYGTSYDGSSLYSQVKFPSAIKFNEAKTYYGAIYSDNTGATTVETFGSSSTTYYVRIDDKLDDNRGCGLTYKEYNSLKKYMLSSVYRNGGFWIGQYEAGADSYPAKEDNSRTPVIAQGKYPYNYITCANAQIKSSQLNSGDYTSSLIFGIQWDLVLKHLQVKGRMSVADLTEHSTNWGNYSEAEFPIGNGKYTTTSETENSFKLYTENTSGYVENSTKLKNTNVLLTTGANSSQNCKMNIYDFAGNQWERTLEKSTHAYYSCTSRGGSCYRDGSSYPASYRIDFSTTDINGYYTSFRPVIY